MITSIAPRSPTTHRSSLSCETALGLFLDYTPAAVALFDRDMIYLHVSQRWLSDYGLTGQEIIGRSHYDIFPEIPEHWKAVHQRCLAGATEQCEEEQFCRLNGETIWLRWEVHPWRDASGAIGGIIITTETTTERTRMTDALQVSEEHYRALFSGMNEGFALHDIVCDDAGIPCDYRFLEINPAFERLTGLSKAQTVGRLLSEVLPDEDPQWVARFGAVALTGEPVRFEKHSPALDRDYEVYVYRPAPRQFAVIFRETTEQNRIQRELVRLNQELRRKVEELETLFRTIPIGIAITNDPKGRHIRGNPANEQMLGLPPGAELSKVTTPDRPAAGYRVFYDGRELALAELPMQRAVRGETVIGQMLEVVREDGNTINLYCNAAPLFDDQEQPHGAVGAFLDITELRHAEEALRISEERHRLLVETMMQGVVHQDGVGTIISMNPAAERILGKNREEFVGGAAFREEHHTIYENGDPFPGAEHPSMMALRTGQPVRNVIMGVYNPNLAEYRWLRVDGVPLYRPGEPRPFEVYSVFEDITERKQAEQELASTLNAMTLLQKLAALFVREGNLEPVLGEIVDAAMMIAGADFGNIQLLDPVSGDLRIEAQRGLPQWWLDFWNSVATGHGCCGTALERGERVIIEDVEISPIFANTPALDIQRRAGVRAVQTTPLITRSGKPVGMFSTHYKNPGRPDERTLRLLDLLARQAADIIERAQTEAALRETAELLQASEHRMQQALSVSRSFTFEWHPLTDQVLRSSSCATILSLIDTDVCHDTGARYFQRVHPDDRDRFVQMVSKLTPENHSYATEYRVICPDGVEVVLEETGRASFDDAGALQLLVGVTTDITARKQAEESLRRSEERFRLIAASTPDHLLVQDHELRYIYVMNPQLGLSEQEMLGKTDHDLLPDEDAQHLSCLKRQVLDTGQPLHLEELPITSSDGVTEFFDGSYIPKFDASGRCDGIIGYFRNVTERKRAREELQRLNSELDERVAARTRELAANLEQLTIETDKRMQAVDELRKQEQLLIQQSRLAAMGEMIGNIAHQWRQPLNILGLTIQDLSLSWEQGEFSQELLLVRVDKAMQVISHMSRTIDDFRNFFRPDKQQEHFKVSRIIGNALSLIGGSYKNLQIRVEVDTGADPSICGYPNEFAQVFLNILNNAKDALIARGIAEPIIRITLQEEQCKIIVLIRDNAGGIPEEIMGKIFDPYFSTKGPEQGTGLGLFMAKTIIESSMGGKLSVSNTRDGAEFRIEV